MLCSVNSLHVPVWEPWNAQRRSVMLADAHKSAVAPKRAYKRAHVEADNTTGYNPSTCDFLQTGLVPVLPLNSPRNTSKSRAACWFAVSGLNPVFHVLNTPPLLSPPTALVGIVKHPRPALFSMLPCGQRSRAEYMHERGALTTNSPALRNANPACSGLHKDTLHTHTHTPLHTLQQLGSTFSIVYRQKCAVSDSCKKISISDV